MLHTAKALVGVMALLHQAEAIPTNKMPAQKADKRDTSWIDRGVKELLRKAAKDADFSSNRQQVELMHKNKDYVDAYDEMTLKESGTNCAPARIVKRPQQCKRYSVYKISEARHKNQTDFQADTPWGGHVPVDDKHDYPAGCLQLTGSTDGLHAYFFAGHTNEGTIHNAARPICYKEDQPPQDYFRTCASKAEMCDLDKVKFCCEVTCS